MTTPHTIYVLLFMPLLIQCTAMQKVNQLYPSDLYIEIVTGGVEPWERSENLIIWAHGTAVFETWQRQPAAEPEHRIEFFISTEALNRIWIIIQDSDFFSLDSIYVNDHVRGGSYAGIFVKHSDRSHAVRTQNVSLPIIHSLITTANEIIPDNYKLHYSIPEE
jgi:hypothetical protein